MEDGDPPQREPKLVARRQDQAGDHLHGLHVHVRLIEAVEDQDRIDAHFIVADGPHFSVWVNGYQVTDWTDDRKPDKNRPMPPNVPTVFAGSALKIEPGTLQAEVRNQ